MVLIKQSTKRYPVTTLGSLTGSNNEKAATTKRCTTHNRPGDTVVSSAFDERSNTGSAIGKIPPHPRKTFMNGDKSIMRSQTVVLSAINVVLTLLVFSLKISFFQMFVTAVCVPFLINLRWLNKKNFNDYSIFFCWFYNYLSFFQCRKRALKKTNAHAQMHTSKYRIKGAMASWWLWAMRWVFL